MTYSCSWSGKCRDFPGLPGLVSPPIASLSDADAEHVAHVGHIVDHYLGEHSHLACSLSVRGYCDGQGTGGLSLNISFFPPAVEAAVEQAAPEVPAAEAPAAADGTEPDAAQPEAPAEAAPSSPAATAVEEPAEVPVG